MPFQSARFQKRHRRLLRITSRELWLTLLRFDVSLIYKAMYPQHPSPVSSDRIFAPRCRLCALRLLLFHKRDEGGFCVIKR